MNSPILILFPVLNRHGLDVGLVSLERHVYGSQTEPSVLEASHSPWSIWEAMAREKTADSEQQ